MITFISDHVKIRTGKADNSADVVFNVGEYALDQIKELVTKPNKAFKITVEEYKE